MVTSLALTLVVLPVLYVLVNPERRAAPAAAAA
jgi:Cu/Ag efflux pump CusA